MRKILVFPGGAVAEVDKNSKTVLTVDGKPPTKMVEATGKNRKKYLDNKPDIMKNKGKTPKS